MTLLRDITLTAYQVGNYFLQSASSAAISAIKFGISVPSNILIFSSGLCAGAPICSMRKMQERLEQQTNALREDELDLLQRTREAFKELDEKRQDLLQEKTELYKAVLQEKTELYKAVLQEKTDLSRERNDLLHRATALDEEAIKLREEKVNINTANLELINGQNALRMASEAFERQLPREMEALRRELKIAQDANCKLQAEKDSCLYSLRNSDENFHSQREIIKQLTQQKQDLEEALDAQKNSLQAAKIDAKQYVSLINEKLDSVEEQIKDMADDANENADFTGDHLESGN